MKSVSVLAAVCVLGVAVLANAETSGSIAAASLVENNSYYVDQGERGDGIFRISPNLSHKSMSSMLGFNVDLDGSYNKHFQFANQDYFDYRGKTSVAINPNGNLAWELNADYAQVSEPAVWYSKVVVPETGVAKLPERVERSVAGGGGGLKWKAGPLSTIRLNGRYQLESYPEKYHQYMNNYGADGSAYYDYRFLPETTFFAGGSAGMLSYPKGLKNKDSSTRPTEYKYGSTFAEARAGVRGRLAERTRVDASAAWLIRTYQVSSGFNEPVFNLRIEEQFSPKDLLLAGYDYDVHDTKFTNFVVDQTTYIGYARILGDQLLLLSRLHYTYSSYSKPFRREDQRLGAAFKIDFSMGPKMKLSALCDLDILTSDQVNTSLTSELPDKPVSYDYIRAGLELTQSF